jgi:hypothetical protein
MYLQAKKFKTLLDKILQARQTVCRINKQRQGGSGEADIEDTGGRNIGRENAQRLF